MSKRLKLLVIGVMLFAVFPVVVSAQEAPVTAIEELTFPISELGGCADYNSCSFYCDDPVNYNVCVDYAKQKGFYRGDELLGADDEFWKKAQGGLGCDTHEACLQLCQQVENFDRCDTFAKSEKMEGGYLNEPDKPEYLVVAREVLGCDSLAGCNTYCDNPVNSSKCEEFANRVGLLGGEVQTGPGGCATAETCGSYCRDPNNFGTCQAYAPVGAANFSGPGGCDSQIGCRSYCEQNPTECRSYAPGSNGLYVPLACPADYYFGPGGSCTAVEKTQEAGACVGEGRFWNGGSCQDQPPVGVSASVPNAYFQPRAEMGNCKSPTECYDYCKVNPGGCPGFNSDYPRPDTDYLPVLYYTPGTLVKHEPQPQMGNCTSPAECYDYCKANPRSCEGFNARSPRPPEAYLPGTYYTPPADYAYMTPPATGYYVTPVYYTTPEGSNNATPTYYTPGMYYTPSYYTPPAGSNYATPTYYTPGSGYYTPSGDYPTPTYVTPTYYTPPAGSNYTTPTYYTPPTYVTPYYYTPPEGSSYTTPSYLTPPTYVTPTYQTPPTNGSYTTPTYYTPPEGYATPSYNTPGTYSYPSPTYYTPPEGYATPPTYATPASYSYPTPSSYSYPTPESYGTPTYGTPPPYGTPTYETPPPYATPSEGGTQGAATEVTWWDVIWYNLTTAGARLFGK